MTAATMPMAAPPEAAQRAMISTPSTPATRTGAALVRTQVADVAEALARLAPIGLDELLEVAELQTRVDCKYVVPADALAGLLGGLEPDTRVLEIDGRREFGYESVYFDDADLTCFRQTAGRRRRRYKVRTRTYLDTGGSWLEVKTRGGRGCTVKERLPYATADRAVLTADGLQFARAVLAGAGIDDSGIDGPGGLAPVLVTRYLRRTLLLPTEGSRVTIDTDLGWETSAGRTTTAPGVAVVETKSGSRASSVDRMLWAAGHRPTALSKYATGLAALHPHLPDNRWHRLLSRHFTEPAHVAA